MVVDVDVLEEEGLLGSEGAEKVLSQNAGVLLFYHQQAINYYTLYHVYTVAGVQVTRDGAIGHYKYGQSLGILGIWLSKPVKDLPAADHQPNLVDFHQFLLHLSTSSHLKGLLQVGCSLNIQSIGHFMGEGHTGNGASHPSNHLLQPYQLPAVEPLQPVSELLTDGHARRIN